MSPWAVNTTASRPSSEWSTPSASHTASTFAST